MQVLKDFSENQRNYLLYQSRREAIIKENTIIKRYEEKAEELKKALKEKKKADEKIKSLMMLLKEKGIEIPDER
ncbi:Uncharacterized protein dnl_51950 [Desulfonema limicola]|uniref:Uncharacterized protein n=1 Tax=Desulfonema limicola TaxID=45656 RepID=A0A975GIT8_9BACT|nr:hypothetical protein [Desulfonema limicola]QTA82811.1 Uncharacterized protein dnl_51950 [Desulfonema limicola]